LRPRTDSLPARNGLHPAPACGVFFKEIFTTPTVYSMFINVKPMY
jgi:hypothetical protein